MSDGWNFLVALNERLRPLQDPVEIQQVSVSLIGEHLGASQVQYTEVDGDTFIIRQSYFRDPTRLLASRDDTAHVAGRIVDACRRGETVVVNDVAIDSQLTHGERAQLQSSGMRAFVGVPLIKRGKCLGTFTVYSDAPRQWTADQIALIEMTADRAWSAGARASAEEALTRTGDRQAFMRRLSDTVRELSDPARILDESCRLLGMHLHANRVAYGEIDGDDYTVVSDYVDGVPSMTGRFPWAALGGSRTEDILEGDTLCVTDTSLVHTVAERAGLDAVGIKAYLCPLLVKDGRFVASFGVHSREPREWTRDEIALVEDVADRIWTTLEHRKAEAQLRDDEDRLAFLLRLNDALRPLSDAGDVQETAARLLGQHLGVTRVAYAEIEDSEYKIQREYAHGVPSLAGQVARRLTNVHVREALARGETVVVNNLDDPRLTTDDRERLHSRQVASFIVTALIKSGRVVGTFGANHVAPRVWTPAEVALLRDVAERTWDAVGRTRTESALRDQQQRLQLALEASGGGSWTWDVATNQSHWDERFRALYGFTADEPASTNAWMPRVHEDDRARVMADLHDIMMSKTRESWQNTLRIVRTDGTITWIQSRGRADRDADGNVTRLTGLDLDFNEHHRLEEAREALREEEHDRALRTLLETAAQGIVSVSAEGLIVTANRAFEAMFGWPAGALAGQPINGLMPSVFRDTHMPAGVNLSGVRKDGSMFPIEVSVNHATAAGDGGHAFAFVTDITDRQRAESALRERTAELEYRTTQLSRMASDLTLAEQRAREQIAGTLHDGLQQMLVIAAMNVEQQLRRDNESGAAPSGLMKEARRQLDKAITAARSLNVELFPPVLQQSGLPSALTWLANWTHEKYRLEVVVTADPRADSPRKDVRTLLFESVRELLFNVVKHANANRVTLDLTLDAGEQLAITICDSGIGFDQVEVERRSKAGQVGWGLFSIRERLTLLGGRFEIDSSPGAGTRVRLVAPRGEAQRAVASVPPSAFAPSDTAPSSSSDRGCDAPLRILLVDDHPMVRKTFRDMLSLHAQFSIVGDASNGFEAIALAHALQPDVILMDIGMPHMDGIEATKRIHAELPDIEILGLSMQPRSAAAETMEQAGASRFFAKGTDTVWLTDHLLNLYASRQARQTRGTVSPT